MTLTAGSIADTPVANSDESGVDHVNERLSTLTDQERNVLDLIALGLTNREIATHMFLSEKTVKNYVTRLLLKCHVRNRTEAAILALQSTNGAQVVTSRASA